MQDWISGSGSKDKNNKTAKLIIQAGSDGASAAIIKTGVVLTFLI